MELTPGDAIIGETELPEPANILRETELVDLPTGYVYGVTRYADLILRHAFPDRFRELAQVLSEFRIDIDEIIRGGGSRASHTRRFDEMLQNFGWGKRTIEIAKHIDGKMIHTTRGHEIDMFGTGTDESPFPGIAVEMEWNNKDPFFDRDLLNFTALHREGALAVGIVVTRGPTLQEMLSAVVVTSASTKSKKYGTSTTHWNKIVPRVNLGGGGECPLLIIGIEPERVIGFEIIRQAYEAKTVLY